MPLSSSSAWSVARCCCRTAGSPTPSGAGLMVASALLGVGGAADSVAPGAIMGDVVGGRGGTVVAVFQMSGDVGAALGPIAAGWVAAGAGYGGAFALSAVVCALPVF